ncbi:MAG: methyltransferase domain-containing protein [Patescibacteria group bacterium]|jgi:tellurite methyltransferase
MNNPTESCNPLLNSFWQKLVPKTWYLDLGAGFGRDALFMARHGFQVVAVEKSPEKVERIRQMPSFNELAIELYSMRAEDFELKKNKYSVINANNVLQFIEKAKAIELIERMKDNLIIGGYLLISCFTVYDPSYEKFKERCYFKDGELRIYFDGWEILHYEEGIIDDRGHPGMELPHKHGIVKMVAHKK